MKYIKVTFIVLVVIANICCATLLLASSFSYLITPNTWALPSYLGLGFPVILLVNILFTIFWAIQLKWYFLISAGTMIICMGSITNYMPIHFCSPKATAGSDSLTILTYNVHNFDGFKPDTKDSPNSILNYIKSSNADIVCIQEFGMSKNVKWITEKQINRALSKYKYRNYFVKINTPYYKGGIACYSKYPILKAREIKYNSAYNSSCVYSIKIGKDTLTLINNHLESNKFTVSDRELYSDMMDNFETKKIGEVKNRLVQKMGAAFRLRANQAEAIDKIISETKGPLIVCGDFNDTPQSYAYRTIRGNLDDAFVQTGFGPGITYHANRFWFRIDHILYNTHFKALSTRIGKLTDSDHYPLTAHFEWTRK